jgi:hypothetical protein
MDVDNPYMTPPPVVVSDTDDQKELPEDESMNFEDVDAVLDDPLRWPLPPPVGQQSSTSPVIPADTLVLQAPRKSLRGVTCVGCAPKKVMPHEVRVSIHIAEIGHTLNWHCSPFCLMEKTGKSGASLKKYKLVDVLKNPVVVYPDTPEMQELADALKAGLDDFEQTKREYTKYLKQQAYAARRNKN